MFFAVRQYQQLPSEDGEGKRLSQDFFKTFGQWTVFRIAGLACVVGTVVGAIATSLFRQHAVGCKPMRHPIIPQEVFTPNIPKVWVPDDRYVGFSNYSNEMWHRLTKSTESVWLADPSAHDLGPGFEAMFDHPSKSDQKPQFYHVSNLHQLHCLNILRGRYFELQYDLPSLSKVSEAAANDTAYHVDHCIEYLRMSIMCGDSWEIESNSPPGTSYELRFDPFGHPLGWGGVRGCANWEALQTWQKQQMEMYKDTWNI